MMASELGTGPGSVNTAPLIGQFVPEMPLVFGAADNVSTCDC